MRTQNSRQTRPSVRVLIITIMGLLTGSSFPQAATGPNLETEQDEAIAAIKKLGGSVVRDESRPDKPVVEVHLSTWAQVDNNDLVLIGRLTELETLELSYPLVRLPRPIGPLPLSNITDDGLVHLGGLTKLKALGLGSSRVKGPGLSHLRGLTRLEELNLRDSEVTDGTLANIAPFQALQRLDLGNNQITDAGMIHLTGLKNLRRLNLDNLGFGFDNRTSITDSGLSQLGKLSGLQELYVEGDITDAGLKPLSNLPNLHTLGIHWSKITGAGLTHLKPIAPFLKTLILSAEVTDTGLRNIEAFKSLEILDLSGNKITDAGLAHLGRLASLRKLDLSRTEVTDEGMVHLKGLAQLEQLTLYDTKVTQTGRKGLLQALPSLNFNP